MKLGTETAAICGLYCGTCPACPTAFGDCLSETVTADCESCSASFRSCAQFPCARPTEFSTRPIMNGTCHHTQGGNDLRCMEEIGVEAWFARQTQSHICAQCGPLILWHERARAVRAGHGV